MFIDSSALVAMMTDENQARALADRMQSSNTRMTAPSCVAEATVRVAKLLQLPLSEAAQAMRAFLELTSIQLLAIAPRAGFLAVEAFEQYGQGRHPAGLDLEKCMTYACARYYRQPLLSSDDAFALTDIERV